MHLEDSSLQAQNQVPHTHPHPAITITFATFFTAPATMHGASDPNACPPADLTPRLLHDWRDVLKPHCKPITGTSHWGWPVGFREGLLSPLVQWHAQK